MNHIGSIKNLLSLPRPLRTQTATPSRARAATSWFAEPKTGQIKLMMVWSPDLESSSRSDAATAMRVALYLSMRCPENSWIW